MLSCFIMLPLEFLGHPGLHHTHKWVWGFIDAITNLVEIVASKYNMWMVQIVAI